MKGLNNVIILLVFLLFYACTSVKLSNNHWFRDLNICKKLQGKVLVYPVFVQNKKGMLWNEEDITEYMDSVYVA